MGAEDPRSILFVGWGDIAGVSYYRSWLPSKAMDAECAIFQMDGTGAGRRGDRKEHDIIVLQHGWEHWQIRVMRNMRRSGAFVVLNVDDWIPTIAKMGNDHSLSRHFQQEDRVSEWKTLVREADGVIASTPWLMERLRTLNPNVALARNGLDLDRYEQWRTDKDGPVRTIGWAGGTGHEGSFRSIVPAIVEILDTNPDIKFVSIGDPVHKFLPDRLATDRRLEWWEWNDMRLYPRNLDKIDINLAPALNSDFFKAKSQLRFYEACAMGNPTVGHPEVYSEIEPFPGSCDYGCHAWETHEWVDDVQMIIDDVEQLNDMRRRCLDYRKEIDITNRIEEWTTALTTLTSS